MISLGLLLMTLVVADGPDKLTPVAVTASSTRADSDVKRLVDGRIDTSWQPDAEGAFGVGQWVRLDFGRVVDVTRIVVHNGVQRTEGDVDRFCSDARAAWIVAYGDRGFIPQIESPDAYNRVFEAEAGKAPMREALRTRYLTIVIDAVEKGYVSPGAVGLAEVEVFGRDAVAPAAESGDVTCGSTRMGQLRMAVIEHCAATYRATRATAECALMRAQFSFCAAEPPKWMPIPAKDFDAGKVSLAFKTADPPFPELAATFVRDSANRWSVATLTCKRAGKACGLKQSVASDGGRDDLEVRVRKVCKTAAGKFLNAPK